MKSTFVNLKIRKLSADTCHEFIEWCGLIAGHQEHVDLAPNHRIYKQKLYLDFVDEYPDYGPKAKMTISRTKFYKWLTSYGEYKYKSTPEEGRDMSGRWLMFHQELPPEDII